MEKQKKNKRIAFWATFVFSGIMLLLLIYFGFTTPLPLPEEEGILVNLGYDNAGSGFVETAGNPIPTTASAPEVITPPPTPPPQPEEDEVLTQDFEEAATMKAQEKKRKQEIEKTRKQEEELRKQKEQEEAERKRKKEEEIRKKEEERKKIEDLTKNAFSQGGVSNSNATSDGNKNGSGNQGDLNGNPNSKKYGEGKGLGNKGIGYSLKGRSPQNGNLPKPIYTANESGTVVVRVTVNRSGNITSASYQAKGSTTTSQTLIKSALDAAKKAKFNSDGNADAFQIGTITYRFVFQ